jgi:hypothetical protein
MTIKSAILTLREVPKRKRRAPDYSHIDPQDLDENGELYEGYSSPCIEPHPFGGGISAGDY